MLVSPNFSAGFRQFQPFLFPFCRLVGFVFVSFVVVFSSVSFSVETANFSSLCGLCKMRQQCCPTFFDYEK